MYVHLDKKRAYFFRQLNTLTKSIEAFDITTSSHHSIQIWQEMLNDVKQKHQLVVDKMMNDDEADFDKINQDVECFSNALFNASCLLENCSILSMMIKSR